MDQETGDPIDTAHKGCGYEIGKGKYVRIGDDELAVVEIESTRHARARGAPPHRLLWRWERQQPRDIARRFAHAVLRSGELTRINSGRAGFRIGTA